MRVWILCGLLLVSSGSAMADAVDDARTAYYTCVKTMAKRLEPSGEPAATIADAASVDCMGNVATVYSAIQASPGSKETADHVLHNGAALAIATVVGQRLCNKTKDCELVK